MRTWLTKLIATGLFTGYSPFVSGTVGTVPAWIIVYFAFDHGLMVQLGVTAVMFVVSVWASTKAEVIFGHDSKKIVIDEWAGMCVSVLFVPYSLTNYLIAFVAFRAFDVFKFPPAAQAEKLPRGWGVTMDDIAAGVQANVLTRIVVFALARI